MKLFELQTNLTSFTYPIVKIVICIPIILFSVVRNQFFRFTTHWINVVITTACFVLTIISVLCIYISIGELIQTYENHKIINCKPTNTKLLTIESIAEIVSKNDIIEFEVFDGNKIIKIGASSECKYSSSVFENKLFYISKSEYNTQEVFVDALTDLFPDGALPVWKIDGLPLD